MRTFKLIAGSHQEAGKLYNRGDTFTSPHDLVKMFGATKFEDLGPVAPAAEKVPVVPAVVAAPKTPKARTPKTPKKPEPAKPAEPKAPDDFDADRG